ncbi:glycerol-3-phosphate 1-O-acyltransferase PlsY [Candidatus Pseudothioglobus singularis]|nr:glycerol-3-phosphate 1-O-acyltransferase PlsY [Candidatus Pseudothioglobus singularis]MDA9801608.1 glycerol-3-phosphate 1-O-acyltransferase PlsY [Candidatus Pseudothioglobus singularis]MDB4822382.1 glycerol-3-phosphate 1-O-acyltransferase PlsY [Candidatus Pseudothioglobus singularis]MDC0620513.1 glycerol-3-phosphate 1-O-acyltransferase PlsY [Candidatus Pseudothioglobus singularis]MDC0910827.1 glycerol-3-phosphate 1-O-acyltransferase PlsY [Candidatus Pseudothioglobus singularis]
MLYFLIGSYLLGSISSAIIICKICNLPDPRTQGSGNPGATNVLRIGGKKVAAFVLIFDGLKGAIPVMLAHYFGLNMFELTIILLSAFLGHVFPIYYGFKGGKGVATYLGGLIGLSFFVGLTFSIIWLIVAKVMKVSSIAALTATLLSPIYFYFITTHDVRATMVIFLINLFIYFTHRENIRRIMNGEEGVIGS